MQTGKDWLKQEALILGATKAEWGQKIDDFDRNQQALLLSHGEASAVCRISEFDLWSGVAREGRRQGGPGLRWLGGC